jgi:hypothetical protein
MSEPSVIDFETFMKDKVDEFDAKKYVEQERAEMYAKAQKEAKEKEKQKQDEDTVENSIQSNVVNNTKEVIKNAEMNIQYSDFSVPTKIEIKKSINHGHGVFAKENISEGEVIETLRMFRLAWRMSYHHDPVLHRYIIADNGCKCRDCSVHGPSLYIPLGYGGLYNHGFDSNVRVDFDFPNLMMRIIATEDITAGKEILFDDSAFSGKIALSESLR